MQLISLRPVIAVWVLLCACDRSAVTSRQEQNRVGTQAKPLVIPKGAQAETADTYTASLRSIGQQTLNALKNGDAAFLASAVDEKGIALGTDNPLTSAADFRLELNNRTGAYCDLLGCESAQNSVRKLLSGRTLVVRALTSKDSPGEGQVDVFEVNPGQSSSDFLRSSVITFFFVNRNGEWRLGAIEYT